MCHLVLKCMNCCVLNRRFSKRLVLKRRLEASCLEQSFFETFYFATWFRTFLLLCVWCCVNEKWLRKGGKFDSCTLVKNWNNWAPFGPTCLGCPAAITFHVNFVVKGQIYRFLSDVRRNTKRRECPTWAGSRHVPESFRTWCSKKWLPVFL